jgi:hypothetical protein
MTDFGDMVLNLLNQDKCFLAFGDRGVTFLNGRFGQFKQCCPQFLKLAQVSGAVSLQGNERRLDCTALRRACVFALALVLPELPLLAIQWCFSFVPDRT